MTHDTSHPKAENKRNSEPDFKKIDNPYTREKFSPRNIRLVAGLIYEGADRVRGRGEKRGREGGEEGEGGGRRGGGRREKRGREEGEEGAGGGRGEEEREGGGKGKFLRARSAPRSRREELDEGAGGGEVRGREGERPTPLSTPSYIDFLAFLAHYLQIIHAVA